MVYVAQDGDDVTQEGFDLAFGLDAVVGDFLLEGEAGDVFLDEVELAVFGEVVE